MIKLADTIKMTTNKRSSRIPKLIADHRAREIRKYVDMNESPLTRWETARKRLKDRT